MVNVVERKKKEKRGNSPLEEKQQQKRTRPASDPAPTRRSRKKKEKRGQPTVSDLGNSPLEEKQQQKRTRPASDPAPMLRSRKKKEKRGQPTLSDLGNSPLVEKQEQKRTRPASGPAPMRRSSCVNPNPDADEICHDEPEMQMGIHQKNREKQVSSSDFFRDRLNWRPMTYDEYVRYKEQVLTSDGFEVDPLPGVLACGLIHTRNLRSPVESRRCKLYSQFAIMKYNKKYSPELGTPKLLFVRVLKATGHVCDVMRYYITFLAKELCDGGKTKTYQAVVRGRIPLDVNVTVLSFRECEQVEGSGIRGKEWMWKRHNHLV